MVGGMPFVSALLKALDVFVVIYCSVYFAVNLLLLMVSSRRIARDVRKEQVRPSLQSAGDHFLPLITLLVPAYNEEVTIIESMRSLFRLRYPRFEIVICNDGSKDRTMEILLREFRFVRSDVEHSDHLGCSPIRGFYELRSDLPRGVTRIVLIDKENGGKADALNACINVAQGEYVTSMDADSLLLPEALLMAARAIVESSVPLVAVGAQVGLSNGSLVQDGRIIEMRLPSSWIARFQIVEYMRSFSQGRVALAALDSLLVLSGVFALLRRDLVLSIGGFLTKHMRARITQQYCGLDAHTVCEDMEIVVRMHRYLIDRGLPGKVAMLPFAVAWTEAPENYRDLGKQRARWFRGLLEVLNYHREIMFRSRFREIGLFALPYQLMFEAFSPILEGLGLLALLLSAVLQVVQPEALLAFATMALAANLCLSALSIVLCIRVERASHGQLHDLALFSYVRTRDIVLLAVAATIANFGYRQFLVWWQLRGLQDFIRGKKGWDKFARKGFAVGTR
jgi:cellulose synthase/poly-beta-1,6-N-acetylglucosamine synthase-like glycosyltransferase